MYCDMCGIGTFNRMLSYLIFNVNFKNIFSFMFFLPTHNVSKIFMKFKLKLPRGCYIYGDKGISFFVHKFNRIWAIVNGVVGEEFRISHFVLNDF